MSTFKLFFILSFSLTLGFQNAKSQDFINIDKLDWLPNHEDIISGSIFVPENYDNPNSRKLQITYIVLKAKKLSSTAFPLIFFTGGPGEKSITPALVELFLFELPIREERDIILFDQRGVGYSSELPDMSFDAFEIMAKDANEQEELKMTRKMIHKYKKKCEEQNINTAYYNTMQNAKDVGSLLKHLGYSKYNLFGVSYGTRLARVVQDMFPQYINSSILDSPALLNGDYLLNRLDSYSLALGRIFDYCDNSPECKNLYPHLKDDYFMAISNLKKKSLKITMDDSSTVFINAQDGIYLIRRLLYQENSREKTPELIQAFKKGRGKIINEILKYEYELASVLNLTMLLSVEKYENFNPSNTDEVIENEYKKHPLIPVKLGSFDAFYKAGRNWHNKNLALEERIFQNSDIPTLIFVNHFDPVTPPQNGYFLKEKLSNCHLYILNDGGHIVGDSFARKIKVIIGFMNNPDVKPDSSRLNLYKK